MTTEEPTETNPTTLRLSVEIVHSRPLSLEITAVEYRVDLHVPYVEERLSQLGEALVGPRGCFLVDRHRIPGVINLDELEAAVFKAERKRRRDAEREAASLAYWVTTGARSHGPPPEPVRQAKEANVGVVAVTNPKRIRGLNGTIYVDADLYETDEIRRALNAVAIWGGQVIPVPVTHESTATCKPAVVMKAWRTACSWPVQWFGLTDDNRIVYVRQRDSIAVYISEPGQGSPSIWTSAPCRVVEHSDETSIGMNDVTTATKGIADWSAAEIVSAEEGDEILKARANP